MRKQKLSKEHVFFAKTSLVFYVGLVSATLACTQSDNENTLRRSPTLQQPANILPFRPVNIQLAQSDPNELLRALSMPQTSMTQHIGAHVLKGQSSVKILDANQEILEEHSDELSIDSDSTGHFHATLDNSAEYGRHAIFVGDTIYLRPRFGPYHQRSLRPGESDEILATMTSSGHDYFSPLTGAVRVSANTPITLEGRQAIPVFFSQTKPSLSINNTHKAVHESWREHASVIHAKGVIHLDHDTGVVLKHDIEASISFLRNNQRFTMLLTSHQALTDIGHPIQIEPPQIEKIGSFTP